ncbi:MAG: hypothetical protein JWO31_4187 [Phycisphaerales bacterium]|nr:hypothetical protein [Phycisphaerales bacterium]
MASGGPSRWFDISQWSSSDAAGWAAVLLTLIGATIKWAVAIYRAARRYMAGRRAADGERPVSVRSADPIPPRTYDLSPLEYLLFVLYRLVASIVAVPVCLTLAASGGWNTAAGWVIAAAGLSAYWYSEIRARQREGEAVWPICTTLSAITFGLLFFMVRFTLGYLPDGFPR